MLATRQTFVNPKIGDRDCITDIDYLIATARIHVENNVCSGNAYFDKALKDIYKGYNQAKAERTIKSFRAQLEQEMARMIDMTQYHKPKHLGIIVH